MFPFHLVFIVCGILISLNQHLECSQWGGGVVYHFSFYWKPQVRDMVPKEIVTKCGIPYSLSVVPTKKGGQRVR